VYALGCVLYECLVGTPPFGGRSVSAIGFGHLTAPPPDPREVRPELSAALAEAVLRALAKDPAERPTTATALARMTALARTSAQP
jgi:serine/threonine-protein kinase